MSLVPRVLPMGDTAFTIEFAEGLSESVNAAVLALDGRVTAAGLSGLRAVVPTYRSLTIHLDPLVADAEVLAQAVLALVDPLAKPQAPAHIWRIPVVYGGAFGLDLAAAAERLNLSASALIDRHAAPTYRVAMLGFLPGYAYLAGLDPRLNLSRHPSPRAATPAGTVSIAGGQALVAGIAAPSGWHLLGRTPVRTFLPGRDPVFLLGPGAGIRFVPVAAARFEALDRAAAAGEPVAEYEEATPAAGPSR